MALDSTAHAHWEGDLQSGAGTVTSETGAFGPLDVSWAARAETHDSVTSPEELIAAAHASCYCMALSSGLAKQGHPPSHLDVQATATFVPGEGITAMRLVLSGEAPGLSDDEFRQAAEAAKTGCPVSQALAGNVPISLQIR